MESKNRKLNPNNFFNLKLDEKGFCINSMSDTVRLTNAIKKKQISLPLSYLSTSLFASFLTESIQVLLQIKLYLLILPVLQLE